MSTLEHLYSMSPYDMVLNSTNGLRFFKHPLYNTLYMPPDAFTTLAIPTPDEAVAYKIERINEARKEKNASRFVFTHERPWRFQALLDAKPWTSREEWMSVAGEVWVDTESPHVNRALWRSEVFGQPDAYLTMDEDEREFWGKLPTIVTAYRGARIKRAVHGLSWTLNEDKARWYARRFSTAKRLGVVVQATVHKHDIAAVFLGRNEEEVILARAPRGITETEIESGKD